MTGTVFEFDKFKLDSERFELYRSGRSVRLERKPMELLIMLAASDGRLVTRAEIAEQLWDREVLIDRERGINKAIGKIRLVLSDDPDQPRFVQTVSGKGYRFISRVRIAALPAPLPPPEQDPIPVAATDPPPLQNATTEMNRWWRFVLLGVALAVLCGGMFWLLKAPPSR